MYRYFPHYQFNMKYEVLAAESGHQGFGMWTVLGLWKASALLPLIAADRPVAPQCEGALIVTTKVSDLYTSSVILPKCNEAMKCRRPTR